MSSLSSAWLGLATNDSDDNWAAWYQVGSVRTVSSYDKLIATARCVTAPASGSVSIKLQHSADYGSVETANWEDLIAFDTFTIIGQDTQSADNFHSYIRLVAKCSDAAQTPVISVYIREKQIGAD